MKAVKSFIDFIRGAHSSAAAVLDIANEELESINDELEELNRDLDKANALSTYEFGLRKQLLPIRAIIESLLKYAEVCTDSYRLNFQNQPITSDTKNKFFDLYKGNAFVNSGNGISLSHFLKLTPNRGDFESDKTFKEIEFIHNEVLTNFYKFVAEVKNKAIKDNITFSFFVESLVESKVDDDVILLFINSDELESYR